MALAWSPALIPLWLILCFGVDLTYWDQWSPTFVGLFIKAHQSRLTFWDFFAQHNEHRTTIPRILYLLIGYFTAGNTVVQMIAGWLAVCGTALGILVLAARTMVTENTSGRGFLRREVLIPFFLANTAMFAITQWENWLWGIGLTNLLPMMFIVWALVVATSEMHPWMRVGIAAALSFLATYSLGNGLLAWPLIGVALAWSGSMAELKSKRWVLLAWLGIFILTCLSYSYGIEKPVDRSQPGLSLGIWRIFGFNLAFLGNIFILGTGSYSELNIDLVVGSIVALMLLAAAAYFIHAWRIRKDFPLASRLLIWLIVAGFAVGSGLLGSVFRATVGAGQAIASRYISFSLYGIVALMFLVPMLGADLLQQAQSRGWNVNLVQRSWERISTGVVSVYLLLTVFCFPVNVPIAQQTEEVRRQGKAALLLSMILRDNPQIATLVVPDPVRVQVDAPQLDELGYMRPRLIRSPDARQIDTGQVLGKAGGMLDQVRDVGNGRVLVTGWAVTPQGDMPADGVFLTYDNEAGAAIIFIMADAGFTRQDIVKSSGNASLLRCGWSVEVPMQRVPQEIRNIRLRAWAFDASTGTARRLDGEPIISR